MALGAGSGDEHRDQQQSPRSPRSPRALLRLLRAGAGAAAPALPLALAASRGARRRAGACRRRRGLARRRPALDVRAHARARPRAPAFLRCAMPGFGSRAGRASRVGLCLAGRARLAGRAPLARLAPLGPACGGLRLLLGVHPDQREVDAAADHRDVVDLDRDLVAELDRACRSAGRDSRMWTSSYSNWSSPSDSSLIRPSTNGSSISTNAPKLVTAETVPSNCSPT